MEQQPGEVLVVEDDAPLNALVCRLVQISGFSSIAALDGGSALQKASEAHPRLILLDLMLPDMSGFEVCEKLKQNNLTSTIPIVMVTGLNDDESRQRGLNCGAAEYIVKPVHPDHLIETIRKYVS